MRLEGASMTFPSPGIFWISVAVLIIGALLMYSTMRLRKTEQDGMFILGDATDKYQKVRVLLAHLIIDLGIILSCIAIMTELAPNVFYMLCAFIGYVYFFFVLNKNGHYNIYIDYFKKLHRKP